MMTKNSELSLIF